MTDDERASNEERKQDLLQLVSSAQALLLVGAGSSARLGYPTWPALLTDLEELARECDASFPGNDHGLDPLRYADLIKSHIQKHRGLAPYEARLQKLYGPGKLPCDDLHRALVRLPFKGILTTNYDKVLEAALAQVEPDCAYDNSLVISANAARMASEFLLSLDHKRYFRRIAHLHGRYDYPAGLILTRSDYERAYDNVPTAPPGTPTWSWHRKILWAILATRRVVFVGFSMDDPYLGEMLRLVSDDLWRRTDDIHVAIMPLRDDDPKLTPTGAKQRARVLKEEGVNVVFYESFRNDHRGLEELMLEVTGACGIEPANWLEVANETMERRLGPP